MIRDVAGREHQYIEPFILETAQRLDHGRVIFVRPELIRQMKEATPEAVALLELAHGRQLVSCRDGRDEWQDIRPRAALPRYTLQVHARRLAAQQHRGGVAATLFHIARARGTLSLREELRQMEFLKIRNPRERRNPAFASEVTGVGQQVDSMTAQETFEQQV